MVHAYQAPIRHRSVPAPYPGPVIAEGSHEVTDTEELEAEMYMSGRVRTVYGYMENQTIHRGERWEVTAGGVINGCRMLGGELHVCYKGAVKNCIAFAGHICVYDRGIIEDIELHENVVVDVFEKGQLLRYRLIDGAPVLRPMPNSRITQMFKNEKIKLLLLLRKL